MKIEHLQQIHKIIFYLILLFIPTQFGRHFWPHFSYISGIRIDYLSPTIYFTDLLIVGLFGCWVYKTISLFNKSKIRKNISNYLKFVVLVLFLLIGILFSSSPMAGLWGLLKLLEFLFLGFYIAKQINIKKEWGKIIAIFSIGIVMESFLAIAQYLNHGSIGAVFYFFGERAFSSQTPGIANASLNGELVLRPYGTFSHPNVLAGYLVIGMILIISNIIHSTSLGFRLQGPDSRRQEYQMTKIKMAVFLLSLILGTIALILTMSRVAIVAWILIIIFWSYKFLIRNLKFSINADLIGIKSKKLNFKNLFKSGNLKMKIIFFVVIGVILTIIFLSPIRYRFANINLYDESLTVRLMLTQSSLIMIKDHLIFGVGLNNFLINLPSYLLSWSNSFFQMIQPVHNIFLLVFAETGIVGFTFFSWFALSTIKRVKNQEPRIKNKNYMIHDSLFTILVLIFILGFFDHYFLTLQQGQLLITFVFGVCWSQYMIES